MLAGSVEVVIYQANSSLAQDLKYGALSGIQTLLALFQI